MMGDEDATFDLKLTIQKLQEELNLYRNGTTAGDLLEMLEEKDRDIRKLKDSIATKDTFLSKLAKAAEQSMCELDRMRKEKKGMEEQLAKAVQKGRQEGIKSMSVIEKELQASKAEVAALKADNESLANSIDLLIPETEQFQEHIDELETDAEYRGSDIEKLQERCVTVVKENKEKKKELMQRATKAENELQKALVVIDKYHEEVVKAQTFNKDLKDRIKKEKTKTELNAAHYKDRIVFLESQIKTDKSEGAAGNNTSKVVQKRPKTPRAKSGPFTADMDSERSVFAHGEVM